jgi:ATP synthase I chain
MFGSFSELEVGTLSRILRPTVLFSLVAGVIAIAIAFLLSAPLAAVGIALGIAVAIGNIRLLGSGVARIETKGETNRKTLGRLVRTSSAGRLLAITVIAIALVLIKPELGIGMIVGLVLFQIIFIVNAGRAILTTPVL